MVSPDFEKLERLAAVFEDTPDFVAVARVNGELVHVNRAGRRLVGLPEGAPLASLSLSDLCPAWVRERSEKDWLPRAHATGSVVDEGALLAQGGLEVPVSFVLLAQRGVQGTVEYLAILAREISATKKVEEELARRARQQAALYEFTSRLQRTTSLAEFYECALDAMHFAIGCPRASILLFDETDVMRFVAWRGLSDGYRAATEGHSPWSRSQIDAQPLCIEDLDVSGMDEKLCGVIRGEGISSLAFVPLLSEGSLIGKFMMYYESPHSFTEEELELAQTIARQLAFWVESRRLSEARQRERELLQTIIDRIPVMLTVYEPGSKILRLNPAFERTVGWPSDLAAGHSLMEELYPDPEYRQRVAEFMASCREGWMDVRMRTRDHRTIETSWANIQLSDKTQVGIGIDITERKRAEDYEKTLQNVADLAVPSFADWCAVDMVEPDGSLRRLAVAHVDPAKVELAHRLQREYPADEDSDAGTKNIVRTGKPELVPEITDEMIEAAIKDPGLLQVVRDLGLRSYMGVPLILRGRVFGVITFISAESGRRYDPQSLRLAEDLAHRATVAIENARLFQEAREADRRKDEFLATLAHELRNPLAPIRNGLEIIKRAEGDAEKLTLARDSMSRQVDQMVRLVDDLLDVARITQDKLELRLGEVELATVIDQAMEAVRPMAEREGVRLECDLPEGPVTVHADPVRLAQVFTNLLNNACKYTRGGGFARLTAGAEGEDVVVCVKDNGVGIPGDQLERVFEIFAQVDSSLERSRGGLGIGLTLVKRLVNLHGGTVEARSEGLGKGSEFVVRLPAFSRNEANRPENKPAAMVN